RIFHVTGVQTCALPILLLDGAGNAVASSMLETIHPRVWQLRATTLSSQNRARASIAKLHELAAALRDRDEERAWQASTRHIEQADRKSVVQGESEIDDG